MSGSDEKWDRFRIKAEVQRRGKTLTEVAEDAGLSGSACRVALNGGSRGGAIALSKFLRVPLSDLFPGLYLRARSTRAKATAKASSESRQKRAASNAAERVSA